MRALSEEGGKVGAEWRALCTYRGRSHRCGAQMIPDSTGRCSLSD